MSARDSLWDDTRRRVIESRESLEKIGDGDWTPQDTVHMRLALSVQRLLDATEPQKPRHEWDDVRWQESDGDYEASCWCGWTETAWAYDAAEESLRAHLKENGVTVE